MSKQEFCNGINKVFNKGIPYGLKVYAYLKGDIGEEFKVKIINSLDNLDDKIKLLIEEVIKEQYIDESIELDDISNIADNKKIIYELEQDDNYKPFEFLKEIRSVTETYEERDIDNLFGFIFRFNINSDEVFVYQHAYSGTRIKNKNVLHIINSGQDKFDLCNKPLLRIDRRAEIVIIHNILYVKNIKILQDKFKFQTYVRREAESVIHNIRSMNIVTDIEKIISCKDEEKLTSAKKIMKLKNSPVFILDKVTLIHRLMTIEKYKNLLKIEDEKIKTNTKKDVTNLLKMLNDDFLKSELTEKEYDSFSKKEVN